MKPLILFLGLFVAISFGCYSQEILDNTTIIELAEIGLDESIIINKINTTKNSFNMETDQLIELNRLGVSKEIINAMVSASVNPELVYSDPKDPMSPHEGGFYYQTATNFTQLEFTAYSGGKSSGQLANAGTKGLASIRTKAVLGGGESRQKFFGNPEFYFYTDITSSSAFYGYEVASPNSFICIKLDQKSNSREVELGKTNILGTTSGVSSEQQIDFRFEEMAPGVFIIWFDQPLPSGEYAFMNIGNVNLYVSGTAAGSVSQNRAFDFSIVQP